MKEENVINVLEMKILQEIEKLAERVGHILKNQTINVIEEKDIRATGDLRKTIDYEVQRKTDQIILQVFSGVNYAFFAHQGTKPHFVPIFPIMRWVEKKGIGQSFSIKSKTHRMVGTKRKLIDRKDKAGNVLESRKFSKEVRSVAYAIAKSISKKGTKGIKFFDLALKQSTPLIEKEIQQLKFE